MTSLGAFLLIQILGTALCAQDWAYEEGINDVLGPKEWKKAYDYCGHPEQSPVNILKNSSLQKEEIRLDEYESIHLHFSNANLTNNGLYVVLKSDDMGLVSFFMEYTNSTYKLAEIRFHWGKNDSVGSEHTFDGKSYPMELQLIFYSNTSFNSYEKSLEEGRGLYVVTTEYKIASEDNEDLSDIVNALESIQEVGKTKTIEKMDASLVQLLPSRVMSFYHYNGSLTSPPCASAYWLIYMTPQTISSNQLEKFRQVNAKYGGKLTSNDRPIQPLGERDIYYNTKEE